MVVTWLRNDMARLRDGMAMRGYGYATAWLRNDVAVEDYAVAQRLDRSVIGPLYSHESGKVVLCVAEQKKTKCQRTCGDKSETKVKGLGQFFERVRERQDHPLQSIYILVTIYIHSHVFNIYIYIYIYIHTHTHTHTFTIYLHTRQTHTHTLKCIAYRAQEEHS